MSASADLLLHAATRDDWEARTSTHYTPAGYAEEGFVHLSSAAQLPGTLARHYPGRHDLVLLTVDPARLGSAPVWEDLYGTGTEFPHVYAPIELAALTSVVPLPCDQDGGFGWWRADEPLAVHPDRDGTDAVHALLDHLADAGFTGGPRPRWRADGLAAVTYVPGYTVGYPLPDWLRRPEPLEEVGALLREAHDASVGYRADLAWAAGPVMAPDGGRFEVVCHRDVGPGNLVWAESSEPGQDRPRPFGLIDWEFAEPAPREHDVVDAAVNLCGHVAPDRRARAGLDGVDVAERIAALAGGYGGYTATEVIRLAPEVQAERLEQYRRRVEAGLDRWRELELDDVGNRLAADLPYLRAAAG